MINLADILLLEFPHLSSIDDYEIRDEGNGPYIAEWNNSEKQPTDIEALEIKHSIAYNQFLVSAKRQVEYPSTDDLVIALWERTVEGRSAISEELEAKRQAIKLKYPKPVEDK